MINYLWPLALAVLSNVFYQICAKSVPEGMNPLASLTITYVIGAVSSFVLYYALNRDANIENGMFDGIRPEEFDGWGMYTNFVCVLATNGSCCHEFLKRSQELNPDMTFLEDIGRLYRRMAQMWNNDNGRDLEALGGGFNVTLEALRDKEKRAKIAEVIRKCADCTDEVVRIIRENK